MQELLKKKKNKQESERKLLLATAAHNALNKALEEFKRRARTYLEQQCNRIGQELFWREGVYTLHIDNNYFIKVTSPEYGDTDLLAGMSMGVTQMAGLALICALARQTQAEAPLVMDTPFARLGPAHISRALSECPKHFPQWILFLQPSEWHNHEYRRIIDSRILKEFTLKRDDESGRTTAEEGYHPEFFGQVR